MVSMSVFALKGKKRQLYGGLYHKCTGNNEAQDELGCSIVSGGSGYESRQSSKTDAFVSIFA